MKRNVLAVLTAIVMLTTVACSGITISGQDAISQAAATIIARRIGAGFAAKNADLIAPASAFCDLVVTGQITDETVAAAKNYLEANIGNDPLLMQDLNDLLKLVRIGSTNQLDIDLIRSAAQGFKTGLAVQTGAQG